MEDQEPEEGDERGYEHRREEDAELRLRLDRRKPHRQRLAIGWIAAKAVVAALSAAGDAGAVRAAAPPTARAPVATAAAAAIARLRRVALTDTGWHRGYDGATGVLRQAASVAAES